MTELPAIPQMDSPGELRLSLRDTAYPRPTFGAAPGFLQCNLLVLPHGLARDFSHFCAANPQACPLIFETAPGQWDIPELGEDIDLRTDLGSYRVFRDGQAVADLLDLEGTWQGDFVTFVLGSSFGLEAVLAGAGIETPYLTRGETPAHYIAGIDSESSGSFRGPMAVTMRSLTADGAAAVEDLCSTYPHLHGVPLSIGDPDALGIESLEVPVADIGRSATVQEGEVPVFWASALTVQLALSAARLPFCIANTPGHLLVTDIETEALRQGAEDARDEARETSASEAAPPVADEASEAGSAWRETVGDESGDDTDRDETGDHAYALAIRPAHHADTSEPDGDAEAEADEAPAAEAEDLRQDFELLAEVEDDDALLLTDALDAEDADAPEAGEDEAELETEDGGETGAEPAAAWAEPAEADAPLFADEPGAVDEDDAAEIAAASAEEDVAADASEPAVDDDAPVADGEPEPQQTAAEAPADEASEDARIDAEGAHAGETDDDAPSGDEPGDEPGGEPGGDRPLDQAAETAGPPPSAPLAPETPPAPMEWRNPPLSAGRMMRQRLAAASAAPEKGGKRDSIFW